jgi:large subunit ribosomal protein L10
MARPEKVTEVEEISTRFKDSDGAILTEYRGLKVAEIAEVRTALRDSQTEYKISKNTLARIAVREVGLEELVEMLEGPTAIAFCNGDVAAAAKALDEAAKKYPVLIIKGGVLNGKVISAAQAQELAKIEPREVLLAKMAMLVNSPAQQGVNVFAALLRNFGSMLAQVVSKKESGELPGGGGAPEPEARRDEVEPSGGDEAAPVAPGEAAESPTELDNPQTPEGDPAEEATTEEPSAEAEAAPEVPAAESGVAPAESDAANLSEAQEQAEAAPESEAAKEQEVSTTEETKEA